MKWAVALEDLGIPEKLAEDDAEEKEERNFYSDATPTSTRYSARPSPTSESNEEEEAYRPNPYAAPETFRVSMEHFIIN